MGPSRVHAGVFAAVIVTGAGLTACATGGKEDSVGERVDAKITIGGQTDANTNTTHDANTNTTHDAHVFLDAPSSGSSTTLDENTSDTDKAGLSIACQDQNTGATLQNSYYRVFALTGAFTVSSVNFAVDSAAGGPQTITVEVGSYTGTIGASTLSGTMSQSASASVSVNDGDTSESVPISATISGKLYVEVDSADVGAQFFIGANKAGQTEPSYVGSTDCSISPPENSNSVGSGSDEIIVSVTGSY
jgi:hypothetical protein